METKICATCLIEKSVTDFYYKHTRKKFYEDCKKCHKKIVTTNALKKKYNTTLKEVKTLLKLQNYKCHICNCCVKKKYDIDHNHTTKKVRGILCHHCNVGLGMFKDTPQLLKSAILYLEQKGHYGI